MFSFTRHELTNGYFAIRRSAPEWSVYHKRNLESPATVVGDLEKAEAWAAENSGKGTRMDQWNAKSAETQV